MKQTITMNETFSSLSSSRMRNNKTKDSYKNADYLRKLEQFV